MIRPKLLLAFAVMTALTVVCAAVGLFFVDRIDKSVTVFSRVTAPLLTESLALVDDAQRTRATFLLALNGEGETDAVKATLRTLRESSRLHLHKLRELAAQPGIDVPLENLEVIQRDFATLLDGMFAARGREQATSLTTAMLHDNFDIRRVELEGKLQSLSDRAEGRINKSEDEVKVEVQTGVATVDGLGKVFSDLVTQTYPIVQYTNRLLYESKQIDDDVDALLAQSESQALGVLEKAIRNRFKSIEVVTRRLGGRMRDAEGQAEVEVIRQGFAVVEAAILGSDGLLAGRHEVLTAKEELSTGRALLDRTEQLYVNGLDRVVEAVSKANEGARADASNGIVRARVVIAASVLLALLGGIAFGVIFARRLTLPLMRLTDHAQAIRNSGQLVEFPDSSVMARADEFGILARSFNEMIAELSSSKRLLIEASDAELQKQYQRFVVAINNMPQGLTMMGSDERLVVCNDRYIEMYDLSREVVKPGCTLTELFRHRAERGHMTRDPDQYREELMATMSLGKPFSSVLETGDGREISISNQPVPSGGWISTHDDITERRKSEAKISHMALHDALTNLPNRVYFHEQLVSRLAHADRDEKFAVLCFDLDRFKAVNDTLGHQFGDILLRQVAGRMRGCLREGDTLARLGGDEFAVLQAHVIDPTETSALAARLNEVTAAPFDLEGHQVVVGVSIGISVAPTDSTDPDQLLKNADMALYRAKLDGRSTYRFFEPEMDALMQKRRFLELDLRKALNKGEFELYYQPLINLANEEISSFEALLRWNHPTKGMIPPLDFIPLAEETELIVPIGDWVLRQACAEAVKWPADIGIAVNVSSAQFKTGNLPEVVMQALARSGLSPHRLELEITESVLLHDNDSTMTTLHRLREVGVRIAMDDFGTGYSSLSYLRSFPFDKIKIDRSFVHNLAQDADSMAIIRAVTGLGTSLGMRTTGEGVETREELDYLKREGCTEAQGYFFSKPKPASELAALINGHGRRKGIVQAAPAKEVA